MSRRTERGLPPNRGALPVSAHEQARPPPRRTRTSGRHMRGPGRRRFPEDRGWRSQCAKLDRPTPSVHGDRSSRPSGFRGAIALATRGCLAAMAHLSAQGFRFPMRTARPRAVVGTALPSGPLSDGVGRAGDGSPRDRFSRWGAARCGRESSARVVRELCGRSRCCRCRAGRRT
jgi:hypothetical protein